MNLSPEQKQHVIHKVAELLVDEIRQEMGGTFYALYCVPLAIAEKMTGLSKPTLRAQLPVVELAPGKHGVRMSDLATYMDRKTVKPRSERSVA